MTAVYIYAYISEMISVSWWQWAKIAVTWLPLQTFNQGKKKQKTGPAFSPGVQSRPPPSVPCCPRPRSHRLSNCCFFMNHLSSLSLHQQLWCGWKNTNTSTSSGSRGDVLMWVTIRSRNRKPEPGFKRQDGAVHLLALIWGNWMVKKLTAVFDLWSWLFEALVVE